MNQTCPRCYTSLAHSEVGELCVQCGYLQRRHHNRVPEPNNSPLVNTHQDDDFRPSNLEAPNELEALLFPEQSTNSPTRPETTVTENTPQANSINTNEPTYSRAKPQIINHHSSSQYRKRLEEHKKRLETPEIESSIEPDSSLDAHYPTLPVQETPPSDLASPPINKTPSYPPANDISPASEPEEPDVIEDHKPHRPSPYLLNMVSTETSEEPEAHHQPKYHSPLKAPSANPVEKAPVPASKHTPVVHSQQPPKGLSSEAKDALSRADALLAAAAAPSKTSANKNTNYTIIIIALIIFVGLGGFFAFSLLKPPTPTTPPTNSPSPSTPSADQSKTTSPTPSNQTESAKRDGQRKEDLNEISTALSAYKKTNGAYPIGDSISVLKVLTESNPPYIAKIANDPKSDEESGEIIKYSYSSDGTKFTITASLENKQDPDASDGFYILKNP